MPKLGAFTSKLPENDALDAKAMKSELKSTKKRFVDLLKMTSLFSGDYEHEKPVRLSLKSRVSKAVDCFSLIISHYDIDIDFGKIDSSIRVGPMIEAELYSILLNVISNSIKSVIAKGDNKEIALTAKRTSKGTRINIMDSGLGVPKKWEGLFDAFVADPQGTFYPKLREKLNPADSYVVGTGSGLGLSIIREIIEAHDGTVCFVDVQKKWKCNLEILLP